MIDGATGWQVATHSVPIWSVWSR